MRPASETSAELAVELSRSELGLSTFENSQVELSRSIAEGISDTSFDLRMLVYEIVNFMMGANFIVFF